MSTIKIKCIDQTLQIINTPKIASGGQEVNTMQFEFCPTWEGFAKTAIFYREKKENDKILPPDKVYNVLLVNNACIIPNEVLQEHGRFCFGVFGVKDTLRLTSEVLKYEIVKGSFILGKEPSEPTPSIYDQILTQYGEVETKYNEVNRVYNNIYNELESTVANMPAKGFVNLNNGGEVVRFWVGTMAEYNELESSEKDMPSVHYVLTDVESESVSYYSLTNDVLNKDIEAVLLFCFQQLEVNKPFIINLARGYSGTSYSFLGCSYGGSYPLKRFITLLDIDNSRFIKSNCVESGISDLTIDDITYKTDYIASKEYVGVINLGEISDDPTSTTNDTLNSLSAGLYSFLYENVSYLLMIPNSTDTIRNQYVLDFTAAHEEALPSHGAIIQRTLQNNTCIAVNIHYLASKEYVENMVKMPFINLREIATDPEIYPNSDLDELKDTTKPYVFSYQNNLYTMSVTKESNAYIQDIIKNGQERFKRHLLIAGSSYVGTSYNFTIERHTYQHKIILNDTSNTNCKICLTLNSSSNNLSLAKINELIRGETMASGYRVVDGAHSVVFSIKHDGSKYSVGLITLPHQDLPGTFTEASVNYYETTTLSLLEDNVN